MRRAPRQRAKHLVGTGKMTARPTSPEAAGLIEGGQAERACTVQHTSQQNAAPPAEPLAAAQTAALDALLAGQTVTAAAAAAGVDRSTLHRWLRSDHAFVAALNAARRQMHDAMQVKLFTLAEKATDCV